MKYFKKTLNNKLFLGFILGVLASLLSSFVWSWYYENSQYHKALNEDLYFRQQFKSDDLNYKELKTDKLTNSEHKTRIVLVQNFNYFDNVSWFSLNSKSENFSDAYSGIFFYDYNVNTNNYELVYEFIPMDIKKEYFYPGAQEQNIEQVPLLLEKVHLGDINNDTKAELVTEWSYCNFNHCVWSYPIIIGFDKGYYVKWTMPEHELTDHDLSGEYNWGGQLYEREVINLFDDRKYKINGGNFISYKYLNNSKNPYIISYNIDNDTAWAGGDE